MLAIAVLVPETALLVPGAAGRGVVLEAERAAAVAAVHDVVLAAPDRVVVVAPGLFDRVLTGPVRPSLAAAGVDDGDLTWALGRAAAADDAPVSVGASVALLLLARGGWTGPVTVVEVAIPLRDRRPGDQAVDPRAADLRALGASLALSTGRLALVVAASLSARNGPDAPYPEDPRAAGFDAAVLTELAAGDVGARARLAGIEGALAADLAVTAWAPLQVLLGAAARVDLLDAEVRHAGAPLGVTYAVALWRAVESASAAGPAREVGC